MGMYDNVDYECICPCCKKKVDGFQSKNGSCDLDTLHPSEVLNFYSACKHCGAWIEFQRYEQKSPGKVKKIDGKSFKRTVTRNKKGDKNDNRI